MPGLLISFLPHPGPWTSYNEHTLIIKHIAQPHLNKIRRMLHFLLRAVWSTADFYSTEDMTAIAKNQVAK